MPRARPIANNNKARLLAALLHIALLWSCALIVDARPAAPEIRFENPFARTVATSHQMGGVNSIVQDEFGFIWIAAENGLGRYDGTELMLYQADPLLPGLCPPAIYGVWRWIMKGSSGRAARAA